MTMPKSIYDIDLLKPDGTIFRLSELKGKYLLIVNTASTCGFAPQLMELEKCYQTFQPQGLEILAFPSNQFNQEQQNNENICTSYNEKFKITFRIFNKTQVNGNNAHPLFKFLTHHLPGVLGSKTIKWNFTKFLIHKDGTLLKRFAPITSIDTITDYLKTLIEKEDPL